MYASGEQPSQDSDPGEVAVSEAIDDTLPTVEEALRNSARLLREAEGTSDLVARSTIRDLAETWIGLAAQVAEVRT